MKRDSVLIVDDDAVFLDALATVLNQRFRVIKATSGESAVQILAQDPPDAIVLDVMMSYPSEGYDLARMLKGREPTSQIPIVLLTGVTKMFEARSQVEGSWMECESFMTKPPDFDELIQTLENLIARSRAPQP